MTPEEVLATEAAYAAAEAYAAYCAAADDVDAYATYCTAYRAAVDGYRAASVEAEAEAYAAYRAADAAAEAYAAYRTAVANADHAFTAYGAANAARLRRMARDSACAQRRRALPRQSNRLPRGGRRC